jgi:mRNA interferase RelE/StbE
VSYRVFILPRARKEIDSLPRQEVVAIEEKIESFHEDPRPFGCKKLAGREGWRLRSGNYRILYKIDDRARTVTVDHVGHRSDVYR